MKGTTSADRGIFSTGRIVTWCVLLILAGAVVPALRTGPGAEVGARVTGAAEAVRRGESLTSVRDTAKTVSTRSRLRGIVAELTLWTAKHGVPRSEQLTEVVGKATATDAWGNRIQYVAPTASAAGWLRSYGPDGRPSDDDIYLPVTRKQLKSSPVGL